MPQFDKITFFNQIFWLFFFFSGFYLIFLKIFLPKLSSVLKARVKKLQKGSEGVFIFSQEQEKVTSAFNNAIEDITSVVKNSVITSTEKMSVWANSTINTLNMKNLNSSNVEIEKSFHKQITTTMFCDRFFNSKSYNIKFLYFANEYNATTGVDETSY
jgi:hypothetical protein